MICCSLTSVLNNKSMLIEYPNQGLCLPPTYVHVHIQWFKKMSKTFAQLRVFACQVTRRKMNLITTMTCITMMMTKLNRKRMDQSMSVRSRTPTTATLNTMSRDQRSRGNVRVHKS